MAQLCVHNSCVCNRALQEVQEVQVDINYKVVEYLTKMSIPLEICVWNILLNFNTALKC